jgi:hypothetical protein
MFGKMPLQKSLKETTDPNLKEREENFYKVVNVLDTLHEDTTFDTSQHRKEFS